MHKAADEITSVSGRLRAMVFGVVLASGETGVTCDEVEVIADLRHQTASARLKELKDKGLVEDSGRRRKTRSGRGAAVHVVAKGGGDGGLTNDKEPETLTQQRLFVSRRGEVGPE